MKFCTNCGKELNDENKFCPSCGAKIGDGSIVESSPNKEKVEDKKEEVKVVDIDKVVGDKEYSEEILSVTPEMSSAPKTEVNNTVSQNVVQPSVQNSNNQKKSNPVFIIIIAVLGVVIFGLLVLIGFKFIGFKNGGSGNSGNDPAPITEPDDDPTSIVDPDDNSTGNNNNNNNNNNNGGNTVQSSTYDFSDYKFIIPTGYTAKINGEYLQLFNYTDKVQFNIQVIKSISYNSFVTSKEEIKNEIVSMGYTVNSIQEEQINGTNSLVLICSNQSNNVTFVITALSDYDCLMAAFINYGSKSDSEIKSVASKLATTATSSSSSFANGESKNYTSGTIKKPEFSMKK